MDAAVAYDTLISEGWIIRRMMHLGDVAKESGLGFCDSSMVGSEEAMRKEGLVVNDLNGWIAAMVSMITVMRGLP